MTAILDKEVFCGIGYNPVHLRGCQNIIEVSMVVDSDTAGTTMDLTTLPILQIQNTLRLVCLFILFNATIKITRDERECFKLEKQLLRTLDV